MCALRARLSKRPGSTGLGACRDLLHVVTSDTDPANQETTRLAECTMAWRTLWLAKVATRHATSSMKEECDVLLWLEQY